MMRTMRFMVTPGWTVTHRGAVLQPGRILKLDDKAAHRLLGVGAVKRTRWWQS
jgi:hypothetical protein